MPEPGSLSITSNTAASCGAVLWRSGSALWATVILKATFRLVHEGAAALEGPQAIVYAERRRGGVGSVEAASEAAPLLPNAGVLLSGHARAPGAKPVTAASVRLGVAAERPVIDKTLHVFGGSAPFAEMPLIYERAFGGDGIEENPFGTGARPGSTPPNIIDPRDPQRPTGFGPVASTAPGRRRLLGALPPPSLDRPFPEVPPSLDARYFQAAPVDQQIERISGREWIVLDGMHASLARIQTYLPGPVARADWHVGSGPARPVDLRADMLVIDADRLLCSVIWRGRFAVEGMSIVEALRVSAGVEVPGQTLPSAGGESLAETSDLDLSAIRPAFFPFSRGAQAPAPPRAARSEAPSPWTVTPAREPLSGTSNLDLRRFLAKPVPFEARDDGPPISASGETGAAVSPSSVSLTPAPEPIVEPAILSHEAPAEPAPAPQEAPQPEQEEVRSNPVRDEVIELLQAGAPLLDVVLVGADLRDVDFTGALLSGLEMRGADLRGACLRGVRMTGVDLSGVNLAGADLSGANLARARLTRANVARARFVGAALLDANLSGARGEGASFKDADLRRAKLGGVELPGADFEGADLRGADFSGAKLDAGATERAARRSS